MGHFFTVFPEKALRPRFTAHPFVIFLSVQHPFQPTASPGGLHRTPGAETGRRREAREGCRSVARRLSQVIVGSVVRVG